ncbi:MAG: hypothetical protein ACJ8EE_11735 [Bradyrhizobium sp.]
MIRNLWNHKGLALIAAIATVACVVTLLSILSASPEPIASAALGPDWQCSRIALVFTTCTRVRHESAVVRVRKEQACPHSGT